jgi:putative inorganic carbon (HCO3(-)) transporter
MNISGLRNNYKLIEKAIWIAALPFLLFAPSLRLFALIAVLLLLALRPVLSGRKWTRTPLDLPIILIAATGALSYFTSIDRAATAYKIYQLAMYLALYFTVVNHIEEENELRQLVSLAVLVSALLSLVALISWLVPAASRYFSVQPLQPLIALLIRLRNGLLDPGTGYQNSLGGFTLFLIPVAFSLAIWGSKGYKRYLILSAFLLMAMIPFVTSSRGTLFGLLAAILALLIIKKPKTGIALLLAFAILAISFQSQIKRYLESDFTFIARTYIWQSSIEMIREFPITGVGLGAYETAYHYFQLPGANAYTPFSRHAHNIFLHPAAETGILSLLAFAWLLFLALREVFRLQRDSKGYQHALSLGLFCSLIGFLFQGLLDSVNAGVRLGMLFWLILALVMTQWKLKGAQTAEQQVAPAKRPVRPVRTGRQRLVLTVLVLLVLSLSVNLNYFRSSIDNNWGNIFYYRAKNKKASEDRRLLLRQIAIVHFDRAIALYYRNPLPHTNLALAYMETGEYEKACEESQHALDLQSDDVRTHLCLARVYLYQSKKAEARTELEKAKNLVAGSALRPEALKIRSGLIQ